jgi:putative flippase GtrA
MAGTLRALRYAAFAVVATLINLTAQWTSFHVYWGPGELVVGIAAGTAAGLLSKYALDKFWIFRDSSLQVSDNIRKFCQYSLTGAFTTTIFWGTEAAFAFISDREMMRYLGAAIGLAIGYVTKFHLDNRFVFRARS